MADVQGTEHSFLTSKWGPAPVWVWALGGLVAAWIFAKYRDLKNAAAGNTNTPAATTPGAAQDQAVAPQFIIEDNFPPDNTNVTVTVPPSAPVPGPTPGPPVVTPPGTGGQPPVNQPPPPPKPGKKPPIVYTVHTGDNLSTIAAKFHIPGGRATGWHVLWNYNTSAANRKAAKLPPVRGTNPNLIYPGEKILIPQ